MVQIDVVYEGDLRCRTRHAPSKAEFVTDAPVDNHGRGASFSPTDLVGTALGSCMLTTMALVADRHQWDLTGSRVSVVKSMVADPARRIGRLAVVFDLPAGLDEAARKTLERTAHTCPVHKSLASSVQIDIEFRWNGIDAPAPTCGPDA